MIIRTESLFEDLKDPNRMRVGMDRSVLISHQHLESYPSSCRKNDIVHSRLNTPSRMSSCNTPSLPRISSRLPSRLPSRPSSLTIELSSREDASSPYKLTEEEEEMYWRVRRQKHRHWLKEDDSLRMMIAVPSPCKSPTKLFPNISSQDRIVSSFSEIQTQKEMVKTSSNFKAGLVQFSNKIRVFNSKPIMSRSELDVFLNDQVPDGEAHDISILSRAPNKEVQWYASSLGGRTVDILCETTDRLENLRQGCKQLEDFNTLRHKIAENKKLMQETVRRYSPTKRKSPIKSKRRNKNE